MTEEDKDLLLKDLSARLPYGVKCKSKHFNSDILQGIIIDGKETLFNFSINDSGFITQLYISEFKPYLFPMSSMTDKQKREYWNTQWVYQAEYCAPEYFDDFTSYDWLNAHHFDYRGLIEKGLAIDATGLNIY